MKKIIIREILVFFLISISAIIYFSCDDSGVAPEEPRHCISGKITDWTLGQKTLCANISGPNQVSWSIACTPIDSQGNFLICLPVVLPDSLLLAPDQIFTAGCSGGVVTFNPPDVKGNLVMSFIVYDGATVIGEIRRNNFDTISTSAFSVIYLNTSKSTVVTGQKVCGIDTLNFNVSAIPGWTPVGKHYTKISGSSVTYQFNNTVPAGSQWKFY